MGIEPTLEAWEAPVLPLNYTRTGWFAPGRLASGATARSTQILSDSNAWREVVLCLTERHRPEHAECFDYFEVMTRSPSTCFVGSRTPTAQSGWLLQNTVRSRWQ